MRRVFARVLADLFSAQGSEILGKVYVTEDGEYISNRDREKLKKASFEQYQSEGSHLH